MMLAHRMPDVARRGERALSIAGHHDHRGQSRARQKRLMGTGMADYLATGFVSYRTSGLPIPAIILSAASS